MDDETTRAIQAVAEKARRYDQLIELFRRRKQAQQRINDALAKADFDSREYLLIRDEMVAKMERIDFEAEQLLRQWTRIDT